jgi:hypothetical protein
MLLTVRFLGVLQKPEAPELYGIQLVPNGSIENAPERWSIIALTHSQKRSNAPTTHTLLDPEAQSGTLLG